MKIIIDNMELIPLKSVGPFSFNSLFDDYRNFSFQEAVDEFVPEVRWKSYYLPDTDDRIYVEDGKIISVACYEKCILNKQNLIGMKEADVKNFITSELTNTDLLVLDDGNKVVLEYDNLGIQLFVKEGFVESVSCSGNDTNERCIICEGNIGIENIFLCKEDTLTLLNNINEPSVKNVFQNPNEKQHCHICGEWIDRIIIEYKEWIYICNKCIDEAKKSHEL